MSAPAILLFVKAPRPGLAKTRLTALLGRDQSAVVAARLARDALRSAQACLPSGGRLVVAYAPEGGRQELEALAATRGEPPPLLYIAQSGTDLGSRMHNAAAEAFEKHGLGPVVLMGADCPLMPASAVTAAFTRLRHSPDNIVLGPAEDGGYYLLGMRQPVPGLFDDISWSTSSVLEHTKRNARRLGQPVFDDLPVCYDIDTPADLLRLRDDLEAVPALRERAPAIARWLAENPLPSTSSWQGGGGHPRTSV